MPHRILISHLIEPGSLVALPPETTVAETARQMLTHHIGLVAVVDGDEAVGVVTERDINFRVVARGREADKVRLDEIMSKDPVLVAPETNIFEALKQVVNNRFRYAVVGVGRQVVGVVPLSVIFAEITKFMGRDIAEIERFMRGDEFNS